jgi:hypothetical protein
MLTDAHFMKVRSHDLDERLAQISMEGSRMSNDLHVVPAPT